ncbi:MAG: hypothetical protein HKN87_06450 [Saprospiraceae bacterium]|nr:hypothetical protein [Saprospiraceae bacterium]
MRKFTKTVALAVMMLGLSQGQMLAQDDQDDVHNVNIAVPEVALLDIESNGSKDITLGPDVPTEAGEALDFSNETNSDLWINYSSIVGSKSDPRRDVTVQITSGEVPSSMLLSVEASADAGAGDGMMGTPGTSITLNAKAQDIITGVGSAYTGNGPSKGHLLTYKLSLDPKKGSYASLDFDQANTLGITYTLTDQ